MNRDFKKAIELYTKYQVEETDLRKRDRALWSVAGIHRQSGDINSMIQTYDKWRRTYGGSADNADDFVADVLRRGGAAAEEEPDGAGAQGGPGHDRRLEAAAARRAAPAAPSWRASGS